MDNIKTGAFIKALRTEKGLTQRELAERLHITDRAVSKWERGLSAPDIALLEPLAEILGVSVVELIRGERIPETEQVPALEEHTREMLVYSGQEIRRRRRSAQKTAAFITAGLLLFFILWGVKTGRFFLLDTCTSPNGANEVRIYRKHPRTGWFSPGNNITLAAGQTNNSTFSFGGYDAYKGLWWSPDSDHYVLALDYNGYTTLALAWNGMTFLNGFLDKAILTSKLADYGLSLKEGGARPNLSRYEFVQWGPDSNIMLIYYSFTGDNDGKEHTGYFWFDCKRNSLFGLFELDADRGPELPYSPIMGIMG